MKGHPQDHSLHPAESDPVLLDRAAFGHELGNLLNGLLGMAQIALETGGDPAQARWLRAIHTSGKQLRRLFERHGLADGRRARACWFDGTEWLEQLLLSHAPAAAARGARLVLVIAAELPRAWCTDPCLLQQALDNLVRNAVRHAQDGDVAIEARGGAEPGTLVLEVSDRGPGLPRELGEEIFQAYVRGAPAGSEPGQGLGLYICRTAVTALGGGVCACSSPVGARFRITLPGVLPSHARPGLEPSLLLDGLHCRLLLKGALRQSVAGILDRWGVSWSDRGGEPPRSGRVRMLELAEAQPARGAPGPDLLLSDAAEGAAARRLPGPVLESTLIPALVLARDGDFSRRAGRDSRREPSRSGPQGDSGRPPG